MRPQAFDIDRFQPGVGRDAEHVRHMEQLEFVPFSGSIVSGLLAVLIAFVQGPQMALYVALLFVGIQQLGENVLVPLVQRWAVKLPPVLSVAAVVVFGTLFGIPGIVFGTPLMVVAMVLICR